MAAKVHSEDKGLHFLCVILITFVLSGLLLRHEGGSASRSQHPGRCLIFSAIPLPLLIVAALSGLLCLYHSLTQFHTSNTTQA